MRWMIGLAALLALGAGVCPAQTGAPPGLAGAGQEVRVEFVDSGTAESTRERYEEIEIMARLLDRGIWKAPGGPVLSGHDTSSAFSPDGRVLATGNDDRVVRLWDVRTGKQIDAHAHLEMAAAQGVYLKGQGIVFTATLPLHFQKVVGGPDKAPAEGLTEWERLRKELRGEKVTAEKPHEQSDTSVADAVLHVLAANGKNLTRLPDGESVTVTLTLPRTPSCVTCHSALSGMGGSMGSGAPGMMGAGGMGSGMAPFGGGMPGAGGLPPGGGGSFSGGAKGQPGGSPMPGGGRPPGGSGTSSGSSTPGSGGSGSTSGTTESEPNTDRAEFRKYALLGDLAMKQHDYEQAVQAFRKASGVYKKLPSEAAAQLEMIEVATKLARALIAQGKTAEAENIVKFIIKTSDGLAGGATLAKPAAAKAPMPLPGKLIISVPKKLLDQAGSGKMSFDEFRKAASVEYLTFDKPTEKPKGDTGKP